MQQRIKVLDGIRGLAIVMILLFHFLNNPLGNNSVLSGTERVLVKATEWGWTGVDLFFVLSGFLIGSILLNNRNGDHYFKTFYLRRVLRILPTYFLLLIVFYIVRVYLNNPEAYIFQDPIPFVYYLTFSQNIIMGLKGSFGSQGLGPTWSLAIEEQFYLLCPLLIFLIKPRKLLYWLLIFVILAPMFRYFSTNWYMSYTWFICRMDSLAIGVITALYQYGEKEKWYPSVSFNKLVSLFLSLLILMMAFEIFFGSLGIINNTIVACFFALFIMITLRGKGFIKKIFSWDVLVWLGIRSYPLYLFHLFFNGLGHMIILDNLKPKLETNSEIFVTLLALMISILFSDIVHRYIEKPFISIGKKISY